MKMPITINPETKRRFKLIGLSALALGFLLIGLFFIFLGLRGMREARENLSALNNGERTTGTIISKELGYDNDHFVDSANIKYTFTPSSGQELVGSYHLWPISEKRSNNLNIGDRIEIAYDQQNPTINLPVDLSWFYVSRVIEATKIFNWLNLIFLPLIFGILAFLFGLRAWILWRQSKNRVS
jgi:hypothetical protein